MCCGAIAAALKHTHLFSQRLGVGEQILGNIAEDDLALLAHLEQRAKGDQAIARAHI